MRLVLIVLVGVVGVVVSAAGGFVGLLVAGWSWCDGLVVNLCLVAL